jgi:hypothetical protein
VNSKGVLKEVRMAMVADQLLPTSGLPRTSGSRLTTKRCPCGSDNPAKNRFCGNCGARFGVHMEQRIGQMKRGTETEEPETLQLQSAEAAASAVLEHPDSLLSSDEESISTASSIGVDCQLVYEARVATGRREEGRRLPKEGGKISLEPEELLSLLPYIDEEDCKKLKKQLRDELKRELSDNKELKLDPKPRPKGGSSASSDMSMSQAAADERRRQLQEKETPDRQKHKVQMKKDVELWRRDLYLSQMDKKGYLPLSGLPRDPKGTAGKLCSQLRGSEVGIQWQCHLGTVLTL